MSACCSATATAATFAGGAVIGLSTHTPSQIDAAIHEPVTYIAIGPVFGTATKDTGYTAVGLERIQYAAAALLRSAMLTDRPPRGLVAIGGGGAKPRVRPNRDHIGAPVVR